MISFFTDPPLPPKLRVEGVTSSTATLSWSLEEDEYEKLMISDDSVLGSGPGPGQSGSAGSHIDGFLLSYKSNHLSNRESTWHSVQIGASHRNFVIRNLKCGTPHSARIQAFNRIAKSEDSQHVQFATKGSSKSPIKSLLISF